MVGIPGQQLQVLYSMESGFVEAALLSPPHTFSAARKGFNKLLDVGAMVEMPGGGLTTLVKTIQSRPAEVKTSYSRAAGRQGRGPQIETKDR